MTQYSGFWDTEAVTPAGHQQDGYDEIFWSRAAPIFAACRLFEGVAENHLDELEVTGADNTATVATGGAMVDGKWYLNDAPESVNIPDTATHTRYDRIVLRCDWSAYTVEITRIAGTEAASPGIPDLADIPGTEYDIPLALILVNTDGIVSITDDRRWARRIEDTYLVHVLDDNTALTAEDDLFRFPVLERHDGGEVIRLWARLATTSSSGNVVVRFYNVTISQTIASVTVTAGQVIGFQTTITNDDINENDDIRIDVTSAGTGAEGLQVQMTVQL